MRVWVVLVLLVFLSLGCAEPQTDEIICDENTTTNATQISETPNTPESASLSVSFEECP